MKMHYIQKKIDAHVSLQSQGMFSPDREPHPAVTEIKFLQQPVFFSGVSGNSSFRVSVSADSQPTVALKVENRYSFRDLSHLAWSWELVSNRSSVSIRTAHFQLSGNLDSQQVLLKLQSVVTRVRKLEKWKPAMGNSYFLNIRGCLNKDTSWADAGHVLVRQQFGVTFEFGEILTPVPTPVRPARKVRLEANGDDGNVIEVFRVTGSERRPFATIDKQSGGLSSYCPLGRNLLSQSLLPNFCRAATDNDKGGLEMIFTFCSAPAWAQTIFCFFRGLEDFSHWSRWGMVGLDYPPKITCIRTRITDNSDDEKIGIVALCKVTPQRSQMELFHVKLHYVLYADGRIGVTHHVVSLPFIQKTLSSLPRVGMTMQLDPSLYHIQYHGRGPEENYPDRKSGSEIGVYNTTPTDMAYRKYIVPGENGSRSDCERISFRSGEGDTGDGLVVVQRTPDGHLSKFSCSALLHSITELHEATHTCDLEPRENGKHPIHVNVDHALMGVGGDTR